MAPQATLQDLQRVVEQRASDIRLFPQATRLEFRAYVSMLRSTFSHAAQSRQRDHKAARGDAFLFVSDPGRGRRFFDFPDLPRSEIIIELAAGSGFSPWTCERLLEGLEEHIGSVVDARGQLEIEGFGLFEKRADEGYQLQLVEERV